MASESAPHSSSGFPSLADKRHWYRLPVLALPGKPHAKISYGTQSKSMSNVLKSVNIVSSKKTHLGRKTGARLAEEAGVSAIEIARQGKWKRDVLEDVYLRGFSASTMRGLAGFTPNGGDYFLPRNIPVPASLQRKIMPEIEKWLVTRKVLDKRPLIGAGLHISRTRHESAKRETWRAGPSYSS